MLFICLVAITALAVLVGYLLVAGCLALPAELLLGQGVM
jgi:hypothetical protein